jgi:hypothetical protein
VRGEEERGKEDEDNMLLYVRPFSAVAALSSLLMSSPTVVTDAVDTIAML